MNYINLSCCTYVDGKNDIVLRPDFTLPEFKLEDSNIPLDIYSNPFSILNLNTGIAMPFKRTLKAKQNKRQAYLTLHQLALRQQGTTNLLIYTWDDEMKLG